MTKKGTAISLLQVCHAIFKSSIFADIRGSIGGTTFARNKAGAYARNRTKPTNPNTDRQSLVRSRFGSNAFGFSQLTQDQVLAWNQFSQGYPAINRLGESYTPTGKQGYMLCNQNLAMIGQPAITVPPYDAPVVPNCFIDAVAVTIVNTAGLLTALSVNHITSDLSTAIITIQATPAMQAARQSYRNRMRQLHFAVQDVIQILLGPYVGYFGSAAVTAGQIINFRASATDPATGVSSAWMYFSIEVPEAV